MKKNYLNLEDYLTCDKILSTKKCIKFSTRPDFYFFLLRNSNKPS